MLRYPLLFLTFSVLSVYMFACATIGQDIAKEPREGAEVQIYEVFGMD